LGIYRTKSNQKEKNIYFVHLPIPYKNPIL